MRGLRNDVRGISPVVATIILIAAAGVSAGVIMAYVSGMGVYTPRVMAGTADGRAFDYDPGAAENYKNANLTITAKVTSGGFRDVGDPTYGFVVRLANPRTGQTFVVGLGVGNNDAGTTSAIENYGKTITLVKTTVPAGWTGSTTDNAFKFTLRMSPTSAGTVPVGSTISIDVEGVGLTTAERGAFAEVWKDRDTIDVYIAGRDSLTLMGFDGAYLIGIGYIA